ncbi:fluoride efflux transporter CrcB [Lysinibacillus sp. 2017]|uniref:fluoride efflux transporter FluC n=1 Tax=unclassified Lysinibacillus TaxID=2636778 RepID=UPI000D528927|nr:MULTISPECIES: CrcB family protein [unclassified Lysinibacillus]AWE08049.1 fluoride efflux transporter CrcB [Lysinibacillus sp. 2017]TGN36444.1 CrcB family protein [Lysinibacillus sp. S2017]
MIFVAIGGFFGAIGRFTFSEYIKKKLQKPGYFATFIINCIGSLLLGLIFGFELTNAFHQLFAIGFLGAFTTFSTFSFEVVQLVEKRNYQIAIGYLISSICLGVLFAFIGYFLATL